MKNSLKLSNDLLSKVLFYLNLNEIKSVSVYKKYFGFVKNNKTLWNSFCLTEDLTVYECIQYLMANKAMVEVLQTEVPRLIFFDVKAADITQLSVINNRICVSSDDKTLKIFDIEGKYIGSLLGHTGGIWCFDGDSEIIVTGSTDKTLRIYDQKYLKCQRVMRKHSSPIRVVKVLSNCIIAGSNDGKISIWDRSGHIKCIFKDHTCGIRSIDVYKNYLVSGSYDGSVKLYDLLKYKLVSNIVQFKNRVYVVKISKNYIAAAGLDGVVSISSIYGENFKFSMAARLINFIDINKNYVIASGDSGEVIKYDFINKKTVFSINLKQKIKSQHIYNNYIIISTLREVLLLSLETGKFISTLLITDEINTAALAMPRIIVGMESSQRRKIAILDYSQYV